MNKLDHYPISGDFDYEYTYFIAPEWREKDEEELRFAIEHYINVILDIRVLMTKRGYLDASIEEMSQRALKLWEEGVQEEAVEVCRKIIAAGNAPAEIHLMHAEYALSQSDYETAESSFRAVILKEQESIEANAGLIRTLIAAGKTEGATEVIENLRERDPDLADILESIVGVEV